MLFEDFQPIIFLRLVLKFQSVKTLNVAATILFPQKKAGPYDPT